MAPNRGTTNISQRRSRGVQYKNTHGFCSKPAAQSAGLFEVGRRCETENRIRVRLITTLRRERRGIAVREVRMVVRLLDDVHTRMPIPALRERDRYCIECEDRENAADVDVLEQLPNQEWHTTLEKRLGELLRGARGPDEDGVSPDGPVGNGEDEVW